MATDPVCGMYVDERSAHLKLVRENRTYYFCASACLQEFNDPTHRTRDLERRLVVGWPLALAALVLTYLRPFPSWAWIALVAAAGVQGYAAYPFYRGSWEAFRGRSWNMDVLIAVGSSAAFLYSLGALLLPHRLPPDYFFDASSLIVTLILTGNLLEHLARDRARGTLRNASELLPPRAHVLRGGQELEVRASDVVAGDLLRVRPGERFPADGLVREGRSEAVEGSLTGEGLPSPKGPGDPVRAGTVNGSGALTVVATHVGEDTVIMSVVRLVSEAETHRVPLQRLADRISAVFVPVVLLLGGVAALAWALTGVALSVPVLVFVSVVISACPCAFGLATPAALLVGTKRGAEQGILYQGSDAMERAAQVQVVVVDKTGTLTSGTPSLERVVVRPGVLEEDVLRLAAALEGSSEHPLARAVVSEAERRRLKVPDAVAVTALPGRGVRALVEGRPVEILRGDLARGGERDLGELAGPAGELSTSGRTWSVLLAEGRPLGILGFADRLLPGTPEALQALRARGVEVVMATGDQRAAAERVARELGVAEVHAELDPGGKLALLRDLQQQGRKVAYVGDGINDAPALAGADLGIVVVTGSDLARSASGVALLRPGLSGVSPALELGRRTVRKVQENFAWALGYNLVLLPIAAGALVPLFGLGLYASLPMFGAAAMGLSSTAVLLNSLTLPHARAPAGAPRSVLTRASR